MNHIRITKDNAQHAANVLGISEYIKGNTRSYYEHDCPLLAERVVYGDVCKRKCSLYGKAFGEDNAQSGTQICPMYRISCILRGEGYFLSVHEDVLYSLECEDI